MIKMVCFDLDGTLLDARAKLTEASIKMIKDLLDDGIEVAIVTGRPMFFAQWIKEQIDPRVIVIAANGSEFNINNQTITYPYEQTTLKSLVEFSRGRDISLYMYSDDTIYSKSQGYSEFDTYTDVESLELFPDLKRHYDDDFTKALQDDITIIYVNSFDKKTFNEACEFLDTLPGIQYGMTGEYWLDLNTKNVNKGTSLLEVAKHLEIAPDHIMAFGDSGNDIGMFKVVGHPVAMANAYDFVKEQSRYVTEHDHQSDGIVQFMKENVRLFNVRLS